MVTTISVFAFVVFILNYGFASPSPSGVPKAAEISGSETPPLDVFQVQAPLRKSYDGPSCQQVIVQHSFGASFGSPYVGE
jgi:hypothetical protein